MLCSGTDGSLQFTAQVDPTGTGKSFQAITVTTNGPNSPPSVEKVPSEQSVFTVLYSFVLIRSFL
jgi:hypothetical protein